MSRNVSHEFSAPQWLRQGVGRMPAIAWSYSGEGGLTAVALARESGDVFLADESRALVRLDRDGEILAMTRFPRPIRVLDVSDDGAWGVAVVDDCQILRFDHDLKFVWELELPEPCLTAALAPFGHHVVAAMVDSQNWVVNEGKRRLAQFESLRPLAHVRFCTEKPEIYGAAEHGHIGCYDLGGGPHWNERFWSNVGDLSITGDGDLLYLAASAHGVQVLDGDGGAIGAYMLEGTVRRVSSSYEPHRLLAATIERGVFWLDAKGDVLWSAIAPDDVLRVLIEPFGLSGLCAFAGGEVVKLDWGGI